MKTGSLKKNKPSLNNVKLHDKKSYQETKKQKNLSRNSKPKKQDLILPKTNTQHTHAKKNFFAHETRQFEYTKPR